MCIVWNSQIINKNIKLENDLKAKTKPTNFFLVKIKLCCEGFNYLNNFNFRIWEISALN